MIEEKKVFFINKSTNEDPEYSNLYDSGFDLRAWIIDGEGVKKNGINCVILDPLERRLIHTGIYVNLPENTELQVRSKSGQTLKKGLVVANSPGTVDNGYTGEICVIAFNISKDSIIIENGEKIAQGVICPVYYSGNVILQRLESIDKDTERGEGGFGSTGTK